MPRTKPRLYRDPVHDTIALRPDTEEGRLLIDLIDAREVQRLRRIRQLALSSFVYHGAEHSRFAHSVGVAWLAVRMLDAVGRTVEVSAEARMSTLAAALLHDLGHGPFSHALEGLSGAHHEDRSVALVLDPRTDVHRALARRDARLPEEVALRIRGGGAVPPFLREIVSSQLDADRLDYILRDGRMTGVGIGAYDLGRILVMLDVVDDHLGVHAGGQAAVEGYLLARFHMYRQVYLHKTSRTAERMLVAALRRAASLHDVEGRLGSWPGGALGDLLRGAPVDPVAFAGLDDVDVWDALKRWTGDGDPVLRDLAAGLVHRRLWKTRVLAGADDARTNEKIAAARSIARVKGFDPDHHVLVDESHDSPYRPFTGVEGTAESIRLIDRRGSAAFIEDRSEVVQMLGRMRHRQRLLCFHPDLAPSLRALFEDAPGS